MTRDERSRLDETRLDEPALTELLRAAAPPRATPGEHPDLEELLEYHLRALPDEVAESVRDHLVDCRECAEVVLDFEAFSEVPEPSRGGGAQEAAVAGGADRFVRRGSSVEAAAPRDLVGPAHRAHHAASRWMTPLAATLLVTTLGLAAWVAILHLGERSPRSDVAFRALSPTEPAGTVRGEPQQVVVPAWARRVFLLLSYGGLETFERYRLVLVDAGGGTLWQQSDVPRDEDGTFMVEVDRRELPAGGGTLRLLGVNDGSTEVLAEYRIDVEHRSPPRARD